MDDRERFGARLLDEARVLLAGTATGSAPARPATRAALAAMLDHTLLRAEATAAEVRTACDEARAHGFASVCVHSNRVGLAAEHLAGSKALPIAVIGFPLGAALTAAKAFEARCAVEEGAREIDMVIAIGLLKDRDFAAVHADVREVVAASGAAPVKVILETALLTDKEKVIACLLAKEAGAAFVKTSTGFGPGGATVSDVALMRRSVGDALGVKASGGIRTADDALRMIDAGATRLGTSASVSIVTGVGAPGAGY